MKLFIHLEVGDWRKRGYDRSWLHYASSQSSDILGADLDNQSEQHIADLVVRLIGQSEAVFVLMEVHEQAPLGSIPLVLGALQQSKKLSSFVISGQSTTPADLEEIGVIYETDENKIKERISDFAA